MKIVIFLVSCLLGLNSTRGHEADWGTVIFGMIWNDIRIHCRGGGRFCNYLSYGHVALDQGEIIWFYVQPCNFFSKIFKLI